jgi:hypothetical protein
MAHNDKNQTLNIEISNLTLAQAEALETMLSEYVRLGSIGASRWVAFYADGDGNFQPQITINGHEPKFSKYLQHDDVWERPDQIIICDQECRIDFDQIAWRLRD